MKDQRSSDMSDGMQLMGLVVSTLFFPALTMGMLAYTAFGCIERLIFGAGPYESDTAHDRQARRFHRITFSIAVIFGGIIVIGELVLAGGLLIFGHPIL
jgi:hypothetical protein